MKCIIFFILFLKSISADNVVTKLIQKSASVANAVYEHQQLTSVVWSQNNEDNVDYFLNIFRGTVVCVTTPMMTLKTYENSTVINMDNYNQTVLFGSSVEEFEIFISTVNQYSRTPIFLILVMTGLLKNQHDLSKIAEVAWHNDLANIIIISANEAEEINLTTYFPYSDGSCKNFTPVVLQNFDLFPKKFKNFHKCVIKATVLHFLPFVSLEITDNGTVTSISGIDGKFFMLIINALNSTVEFVSSTDHGGFGTYINNKGTGSIGDLVRKKADILVPAGFIIRRRYLVTQITHPYHIFETYWCGPKRREIYAWAKVLIPLFTSITPLLLLSFVAFVIVTTLLKKYKVRNNKSITGVSFQSFVIFLGQEVKFETTSSIVNSLYVLWIWFCFIVRIVYQGDLIHSLEKDFLEPRFGAVENAIKDVDGIGGAEVILEYYRGTPLERIYEVLPLVEIPVYLDNITKGKRYILATDLVILNPLQDVLQILDKPISRSTTCFYMRPNWPAAKQVDFVLQRLIETGFLQNILNHDLKGSSIDSKEIHPLSMLTLKACFYSLMTMWLICACIFIVELIYFHYKQKKVK